MATTAKVKCTARIPEGEQEKVVFTANYTDAEGNRVNQEWAKYTPGFALTMWVLPEVPFEVGKNYTLTFEED